MTARARQLHSNSRSAAFAVAILAVACARSSSKQVFTEATRDAVRPVVIGTAPTVSEKRESMSITVKRNRENPPPSGCVRSVSSTLSTDVWFDAAARACHPGATRLGSSITLELDANGPQFADIPETLRAACFSAYAVADLSLLPLKVELIDERQQLLSVGSLQSTRGAIPALGPLCSLDGRFRKLKFSAAAHASGTVTLAYYSGG